MTDPSTIGVWPAPRWHGDVTPAPASPATAGAELDHAWIKAKAGTEVRSNPVDPKAALLDEAKRIATGARREAYGNAHTNHRAIAELMQAYLDGRRDKAARLTSHDAACLMLCVKLARLAGNPMHADSKVDIAGYAAVLAEIDAEVAKGEV